MVGAGSFRLIGIVLLLLPHQRHRFPGRIVHLDLGVEVLQLVEGGKSL